MGILHSIGNFIWSPFGESDRKFDYDNPKLLAKTLMKFKSNTGHYYIDNQDGIVVNIRGNYGDDENGFGKRFMCSTINNKSVVKISNIDKTYHIHKIIGIFYKLPIDYSDFKVSDFDLNIVIKSADETVVKLDLRPSPSKNNGSLNRFSVYYDLLDLDIQVNGDDVVIMKLDNGLLGNLEMNSVVVAGLL